jgi:hypothetical protein
MAGRERKWNGECRESNVLRVVVVVVVVMTEAEV